MLARISVRLDTDTRAALERIAEVEGRTLSQTAARALAAWLRDTRNMQPPDEINRQNMRSRF